MSSTTSDRGPSDGGARLLAVSLAGVLLLASGALATVGFELAWAAPAAIALVAAAVLLLAAAALAGRQHAPAAPPAVTREADALTVLWQRLSEVEARLAEIERHGGSSVRASLSELTAEIGLLGRLMKDVAETVAGHDEHLTVLAGANRGGGLFSPPEPAPAPEAAQSHPAPIAVTKPEPPPPPAPPEAIAAALAVAVEPAETVDRPSRERTAGSEMARADAIVAAIEGHRVELHLQPVVALPQRKVRLYEALTRLRMAEDELLMPFEFLPLAERRGLAPGFDERTVARVLSVARHLVRHSDASVMCNLSAASVAEPGFLRRLLRLLETESDAIERLVLELPQRALRTLDAERSGALSGLVERGVILSMDRVQDLRIDPLMLAERGVRFVKIPSRMLIGGGSGTRAEIHPSDMPAMLARAGIALIAERIENEATVPDLLDMDVPLAQGFLFGQPRPVRAEVYAGTAGATAQAPEAALVQDEVEHKPYRAFLRRASA